MLALQIDKVIVGNVVHVTEDNTFVAIKDGAVGVTKDGKVIIQLSLYLYQIVTITMLHIQIIYSLKFDRVQQIYIYIYDYR